ncbi:uncharacterized protein SCHCODRAFT_02613644 [Schizophyllum commune H4-8]|uniref:uncharacterized protein n=1 Tax=Schizophyllum commune (strain H4-8 / FGSC 9210) TaxID=578458 RepID=UPI00215E746A|nr:uncharacterized protein SCHCODRAFT_02613644 [Schizophyllum commune H4-8]KAI5898955.1 hypothetical protein SCHCODRAFT_02613644 [Schizophyllum commune H4-8]
MDPCPCAAARVLCRSANSVISLLLSCPTSHCPLPHPQKQRNGALCILPRISVSPQVRLCPFTLRINEASALRYHVVGMQGILSKTQHEKHKYVPTEHCMCRSRKSGTKQVEARTATSRTKRSSCASLIWSRVALAPFFDPALFPNDLCKSSVKVSRM